MTNKATKASAQTRAGTPRERAPQSLEKPPKRDREPSQKSRGKPGGSDRSKSARECRPNRPAIRPAAAEKRPRGGPRSPDVTQVIEGEHRKESAKRN